MVFLAEVCRVWWPRRWGSSLLSLPGAEVAGGSATNRLRCGAPRGDRCGTSEKRQCGPGGYARVLMEGGSSQWSPLLLTVIAAMMARSVANWRAAQTGAKPSGGASGRCGPSATAQ